MNGNHRLGARRDGLGNTIDIDQQRSRFDIDENRLGADDFDHVRRRDECHRRNDHLVTRPDVHGKKSGNRTIRPAVGQLGARDAKESAELGFHCSARAGRSQERSSQHLRHRVDVRLASHGVPVERNRLNCLIHLTQSVDAFKFAVCLAAGSASSRRMIRVTNQVKITPLLRAHEHSTVSPLRQNRGRSMINRQNRRAKKTAVRWMLRDLTLSGFSGAQRKAPSATRASYFSCSHHQKSIPRS